MATRKSTKQRILEAKKLISDYAASSIHDSREIRFMNDMIHRLESRKGLTTGMRSWFDELVKSGPPVIDTKTVGRINTLLGMKESRHRQDVLSDFRLRLLSGKQLTEKQHKFFEIIEKEVEDLSSGKGFKMSDDQLDIFEKCRLFFQNTSPYYWAHRRGSGNMLFSIFKQYDESTIITEKQYNAILKTFSSKLRRLAKPRFLAGDVALFSRAKIPCVILNNVLLNDRGKFIYEVLIEGRKETVECEVLKKR